MSTSNQGMALRTQRPRSPGRWRRLLILRFSTGERALLPVEHFLEDLSAFQGR